MERPPAVNLGFTWMNEIGCSRKLVFVNRYRGSLNGYEPPFILCIWLSPHFFHFFIYIYIYLFGRLFNDYRLYCSTPSYLPAFPASEISAEEF